MKCWKESPEYEQNYEKVPCDLSSLHISISDCSKIFKTGDVNCCAKLRGFRASVFQERERLLWGTGSAVRGIGCTRCVRCWKCKMSTSPSFASSMGYHHHHIGLNSFSWHSVSFKDVPRSKQGYYSTGADYLQGLNFNLRNQSPNPAHVVYVKNHTEPNTAGFIATLMWGNVFNSVGCSWGPWSSKLELALFNTKWVL